MRGAWSDIRPVYDTGLTPTVDHRGKDLEAVFGAVPTGLLIKTDGTATFTMANGKTRVLTAGTLAVDIIHELSIKRMKGGTALVWVAFD